jgi:hypothetical protein
MFKNYQVRHQNGDVSDICTYASSDGVERMVEVSTAYCSVHGSNASVGSHWEFAVINEDEYSSSVAQTWVSSLEFEGDIFDKANYASVTNA